MKRRFIAFMLGLLMLFPAQAAYGQQRLDDFIFSDPVRNTYTGRREGAQLINNLRFTDMPADEAARDAIVRSGTFNFFKGTGPNFRPNAPMTIEEALAFVLRAAGYEQLAMEAAADELGSLPQGATAADRLALGYFALARDIGLISADQFNAVFAPPAENVAEEEGLIFRRADRVTREQFAHWLVSAITSRSANAFNVPGRTTEHQSIYNFTDWNSISPNFVSSIEQLVRTGVMVGQGNTFRPREPITRMEAAWVGRSLDSIFFNMAGLERFYGTVGAISDAQALTSHTGELVREVRVRRADGQVDILRFSVSVGGSPQSGVMDAVVLKNGNVGGLGSLEVGDPIEYIVHPVMGAVFYVSVTGALATRQAMGRLQRIDYFAGTATFFDNYGRAHTYALAQGLLRIGSDGEQELRLDTVWHPINALPFGSYFVISLANNIIREIEFAGNEVIEPETWGVVIANNPMLGYLTIFDAQGHERTFNYNANELVVHKSEHYDMRNTIGGIHSLFPNMRFDPRATNMGSIEPGNVVTFRLDSANPSMIIAIHATTNYTTRYGRILELRTDGNMHNFLMEFENGRTSWFSMPEGVMIRREARPVNAANIQPGDWARILINQAVIGPGHVVEAVRAMDLEGDARHISNIIRGQLGGINLIQNQMTIQNAQQLAQTGWANYRQIAQYSINGPNTEYFFNGRSVSLGYVNEFLRHSNAEVYIALEHAHGGERVRLVSFRSGRDELLRPDTVVGVDGQGGFHVLSNEGTIRTDVGTIVRRNGRLVDGRQIFPWDHATVVLNGENSAAVVDIGPAPNFSGVQITRGRIQSVDQGRSFRTQSMALFDGINWHFTPIEREFAIDHNTLLFTDGGALMNIDQFIDYTDDSVVNQVFNIVVDGSRAARIVDAPYATQAVRGIIYGIGEGSLQLRDVHFRNPQSGLWQVISNVNATATANIPGNSIIVDRDQVVGLNNLQIGQQVRVMTTAPLPAAASGAAVTGYIVLVER